MSQATAELVARVHQLLKTHRFQFGNEAEMHEQLERLFEQELVKFVREFKLSDRDRVDFLLQDFVALECKVKAPAARTMQQLGRYAASDEVDAIILVTVKPFTCPAAICGKPVINVPLYLQML